MNEVKASVFRRWPVTAPYRGEQTTRLTGGHDLYKSYNFRITFPNAREARINNVILWNVKVIFLINSIKIRNTIGYIMYLSPHIDSSIIWMIISSIDVFCNGVS